MRENGMSDREEFLQQANVAVLTTVDRKGRPHGAPVWYLYDDGVFVISTDRGSQKARNIESNADVCLVIDQRTVPYFAVMVHGRAELGPALSAGERLHLAVRYLGEERGRAYVTRVPAGDGITVRIRPRKVIEYAGRAGRQT
jgi:PPOX class probable F420-dependent enzyme